MIALTCFVAAVVSVGAQGPIELRGGGVIDDPVVAVSIKGVQVGGDSPRLLGWDEVRRVTGVWEPQAKQFEATADQAWRARERLARGDVALAEPIFDELFKTYKGQDGPTAALVAEGLLRCRLQRGAQAQAMEPWLELLRHRLAGDEKAGERFSPPVLDAKTGLAPALPPIWVADRSVEAFATGDQSAAVDTDGGDDPVVAAFRDLYMQAAAMTVVSALQTSANQTGGSSDAGIRFVAAIVRAQSSDAAQREQARKTLQGGLAGDMGTWREAWRRVALGRSLLLEDDPAQRRQGLLHLLHLPARLSGLSPYLTGVALADASAAMAQMGDNAAADRLRKELEDTSPYHPALGALNQRTDNRLSRVSRESNPE